MVPTFLIALETFKLPTAALLNQQFDRVLIAYLPSYLKPSITFKLQVMPLQEPQASKSSRLHRRNISNTSSTSNATKIARRSRLARLSIPRRTSTSDSVVDRKLASENLQPEAMRGAFTVTTVEAQIPLASTVQTPKTARALGSIRTFASRVSRITPLKKGQRTSESFDDDIHLVPQLASQKATGASSITDHLRHGATVSFDIPNTNYLPRIATVSFDLPNQKVQGFSTRRAAVDDKNLATTCTASTSVDTKQLGEPSLQSTGATITIPSIPARKASVNTNTFLATNYTFLPNKETEKSTPHEAAINNPTIHTAKHTVLDSSDNKEPQEPTRPKAAPATLFPELTVDPVDLEKPAGWFSFPEFQQSDLHQTNVLRHTSSHMGRVDSSDPKPLRILSEASYPNTQKHPQHGSHNAQHEAIYAHHNAKVFAHHASNGAEGGISHTINLHIVSESAKTQKTLHSASYAAQHVAPRAFDAAEVDPTTLAQKSALDAADLAEVGTSHPNTSLSSVSESSRTQNPSSSFPGTGQISATAPIHTLKFDAANALGIAELGISNLDGPHSIKSPESSIYNSSPTKVTTCSNESFGGILRHDRSSGIRSSIEEPERKRLFSPRNYLNQKRRQFTSSQTPCPGDATDERDESDYHSRTFPTIRKFASKMARIMPANRAERGGTLRYQTPDGVWRPMSTDGGVTKRYQTPDGDWVPISASATTVGTSPNPYKMKLSPTTPGSIRFVRKASQKELLNTIQEYVTESENKRSRSEEITNELAQKAQELIEESEKLERERRKSDEAPIELVGAAQELVKQGEILLQEEREARLHKETALKGRIKELEEEVEALRRKVVVEKGDDHLGVQGANPVTGVWSDVDGEKGNENGNKGRGRWRRTASSWALGPSGSSSTSTTGTIVRNRNQNPAENSRVPQRQQQQSAGMAAVIRYHIHHHHYWRVASKARRRLEN